ncbi:MAG: hypothetical protein C0478_02440 [Planctomyces sp.]|nr:hypothetical protein [Planctomyces sp.]
MRSTITGAVTAWPTVTRPTISWARGRPDFNRLPLAGGNRPGENQFHPARGGFLVTIHRDHRAGGDMLLHPGTDMRREGDAGAIVQDDPLNIATNVFRKTGDFTLYSGRFAAWRTGRCGTIRAPFTRPTF